MKKPYRENEWKPQVSGPTELSISSYADSLRESGWEVEFRHEGGVVRLYARPSK